MLFSPRVCFLKADFVCNLLFVVAGFFNTFNTRLPVQHHLGHLFPPRVFGDVLQLDSLFLLVIPQVGLLLLSAPALVRPSRRFLLDLKPSVYIIRKEPHLSILFSEMEHFMNLEDAIP